MISLDVEFLFTNVPLNLLIKGIEKRYQFIIQKYTIPLDELIMGSPISPIFADIVMTDLEEECLEKLSFKTCVYKRCVDDTLICTPRDKVIDVFNKYHPRLQFIPEVETEGRMNFLEVTLIRKSEKLITDWYRNSRLPRKPRQRASSASPEPTHQLQPTRRRHQQPPPAPSTSSRRPT